MPSYPGSALSGPLTVGSTSPSAQPGDYGSVQLAQRASLVQNSTNPVSATFLVPYGSVIFDVLVDVATQFNSATSATLTVGTAAGGSQYLGGVDCKTTGGRVATTYTAAQVTAMNNVGANTTVVATVTPTGATSAGVVNVTLRYLQTLQPGQGIL